MLRKASSFLLDVEEDYDHACTVEGGGGSRSSSSGGGHGKAKAKAAAPRSPSMQADVEATLTRQPKRMRKGIGAWYPDGPNNLDECFAWTDDARAAMALYDISKGSDLCANFQNNIARKIVLTSSYSGVGTAEYALSRILASSEGSGSNFVVHSACDNCPLALRTLMAHVGPSSPDHVFVDVLDRLPPDVKEECLGLQKTMLADVKELKAAIPLTGMQLFNKKKCKLGDTYVARLKQILVKCDFLENAWCRKCQKYCPLSPRSDGHEEDLWIEVAGTTCCPFSSMNLSSTEWASDATLPCMVWAFSTRFWQADIIVHECVQYFQPEVLLSIFNNLGLDTPMLRSQSSRFYIEDANYEMFSMVFTPTQLGIPSERYRRYSQFHLKAVSSMLHRNQQDLHEAVFRDLFFKNRQITAQTYEVAGFLVEPDIVT